MYAFVEVKTDNLQLKPGLKILKAADYSHYLEAQSLVIAAEEKAASIVARAQQIYEKEKLRGYEDGLEQSKLESAQTVMKTIADCNRFYQRSEQVLTNVVITGLRNIIAELDDTELAAKVVAEALRLVSNQKQVTLHVHPDIVTNIRERITDILVRFPEVGYVEVVGDARLRNGGCILETEIGIIDASIDGQLQALQQAIERSFEDRSIDGSTEESPGQSI